MNLHDAIRLAVSAVVLSLFACSGDTEPARPSPAATVGTEMPPGTYGEQPVPSAPAQRTAHAELQSAPGVPIKGSAQFTSEPDGVRANVQIEQATPGKHGIHVHEKGDCSDIPGKSMGSHFAPGHKEHGLPGAAARHLGDLGNIEVGADGRGTLEIKVEGAMLDDGPHSYVGKALIVHEKEDDLSTQPSGNACARVACAVIVEAP